MKLLTLLSVASVLTHADPDFANVGFQQFKVGNYWEWTYSGKVKPESNWELYFFERYTVVKVLGKQITIDMTSDSKLPINPVAHHRIVMNFSDCEKAAVDAKEKRFAIHFYTRNLGEAWQEVPAGGKNRPFTEKFNCGGPSEDEVLNYSFFAWAGKEESTFQTQSKRDREKSWYFLDAAELAGVAASKLFEPDFLYKFELSSYCDRGLSCGPSPK